MKIRKSRSNINAAWNISVFSFVILLAVISWIAGSGNTEDIQNNIQTYLYTLIGFVFVVGSFLVIKIVYIVINNYKLSSRQKNLRRAASSAGMHSAPMLVGGVLSTLTKDFPLATASYFGRGWAYTDFEYSDYSNNFVRKRYKTQNYHFAVAVFDLPRKLPNVFFDSKLTCKREFSFVFRSDQKHTLEGDFSDHFDTYFTEDYEIDSLSFISPEVMESILDAKSYDIEIIGNKLYLIDEYRSMPEQLLDMKQKGEALRDKLLNNIISYRDDRIPFVEGRKTIALSGLILRRSLKLYKYLSILGFICVLASFLSLLFGYGYPDIGIYLLAFGLGLFFYGFTFVDEINRVNKYLKNMKGLA